MPNDENFNDENKPAVAKKGLLVRIKDFLKNTFARNVVSDKEYSELESVVDNNTTTDVINHSEEVIRFAEKAMENHFETLKSQFLEEKEKGANVTIPKEMPDEYEVEHLPEPEGESIDSFSNDKNSYWNNNL